LRAQRTIPDSRLVVLPDTGHVAQMERPEMVAAEVRAFLRQNSTATHSDAEASAT
jgi:pimeloyl-ACP methyl ester carboxylesterase